MEENGFQKKSRLEEEALYDALVGDDLSDKQNWGACPFCKSNLMMAENGSEWTAYSDEVKRIGKRTTLMYPRRARLGQNHELYAVIQTCPVCSNLIEIDVEFKGLYKFITFKTGNNYTTDKFINTKQVMAKGNLYLKDFKTSLGT